jgi:hypothetical protein
VKKTRKPSGKSHTTKATKDLDVKPAKGGAVRGGRKAGELKIKL